MKKNITLITKKLFLLAGVAFFSAYPSNESMALEPAEYPAELGRSWTAVDSRELSDIPLSPSSSDAHAHNVRLGKEILKEVLFPSAPTALTAYQKNPLLTFSTNKALIEKLTPGDHRFNKGFSWWAKLKYLNHRIYSTENTPTSSETQQSRFEHLPHGEKIRLAMWALAPHMVKECMVVIKEDEDSRFFEWLKKEAYKRPSSHYVPYADGNLYNAWGMDVPELPFEKGHVLFGNELGNGQTYFKLEKYGVSTITDTIGHTSEYAHSVLAKIEPLRAWLNLPSDHANKNRKERIDPKMISDVKGIINLGEKDPETRKLHEDLCKKFGIQKIIQLLTEYESYFENWCDTNAEKSDALSEQMRLKKQFLKEEIEAFHQKYLQGLDHPETRTGREIIFDKEALKKILSAA